MGRTPWHAGDYVHRLAERGRRKPEIAGLARTAAMGGTSADDARAALRSCVAADPGLGRGAQKLCLSNAGDDLTTAHQWEAAAREIEVALRQAGAS